MVKLLTFGLGVIGAFWLFFVGVTYVLFIPAGWPNYKVFGVCPACVVIHLPYAGEAQKLRTEVLWNKAQWGQCRANEGALRDAITAQNVSLAALASAGSAAQAEADRAIRGAQAAMARASEAKASISAPIPKADTVCQAAEVVDGRFLESLQ